MHPKTTMDEVRPRSLPPLLLACALLVTLALVLLNLNSCGGGGNSNGGNPHPPPPPSGVIRHVVIIFQENRTPDNLFHGLAGADIANSGVNSKGQTIPLQPASLVGSYDLGHNHVDFVAMYDGGKMDGADKVSCIPGVTGCPSNPSFYYVNPSEVAPYLQLAQQYTFGDRMFQTNEGPSFPAHQFILAGTSAPSATSNLFAAENTPNTTGGAGCAAPSTSTVKMIDPMGNESSVMFPCFEHQTLTDLLENAGLSWKYYSPLPGGIWTAPNAIQHICVAVNS